MSKRSHTREQLPFGQRKARRLETSSAEAITTEAVNQYFFYRGNEIVKLWEQYLKALSTEPEREIGIRFYIDEGSRSIESIFNGMSQFQEKAIVINGHDGSLYKNSAGKTLTLCGEVDYNHSDKTNGVNKIQEALEQVLLYNANHAIKITNHQIIFPYHATPLHWNLGQIELEFDESFSVSEATIAIYEPYGGDASDRKALVAAINDSGFLGAVTMTQQPINQPKQQHDGSSCGAITAENGKEFLKSERGEQTLLEKTYERGAIELRESHIREISHEAFTVAQRDNVVHEARGDRPLENQEAVIKILTDYIERPENDWVRELINKIKFPDTDNERRESLDLFKMFLIQLDLFQVSLSDTSEKLSALILKSNGDFKDGAIDLIQGLADERSISLKTEAAESEGTKWRTIPTTLGHTKTDGVSSTSSSPKKISKYIHDEDVKLRVYSDGSKDLFRINFISPSAPIPQGHIDHFPAIFNGATSWKGIPQFAVITGQNGQGKSQLLKYINHVLTRVDSFLSHIREKAYFNQNEVLYINSDQDLLRVAGEARHIDTLADLRRKDIWMPQVKAAYHKGFRVEPQDAYAKLVCETLKLQIEAKKSSGKWDEANLESEISSVVRKTTDYSQYISNAIKLSSPISFLEAVFKLYFDRVQNNRNDTCNYTGTLWLYDYYRSLSIEKLKEIDPRITSNSLDLRQFMEFMTRDADEAPEILGNLAQSYALKVSGSSPLDEINYILRIYGFKYTISFKPPDEGITSHEKKLFLEKEGHTITPESLSSGEKLILSLLSWKYRIDGLTSGSPDSHKKADNKIKIILLDEFDSHFDPKLCELFLRIIKEEFVKKAGIQVIMATHRVDTVALAPKESIFVIEDTDGHAEIVKCHPLQAMFRMTTNVRSLIDFYYKVYTEGVRDAWFYEAVYSSLRVYSDENRSSENKDHIWHLDDSHQPRLLSRRYEMSFHTTSTHGKGGGNCTVVKESIMRDRRSLEVSSEDHEPLRKGLLKKHKHMFDEPKLYASYGIIDHDGLPSHGLSEKCLDKSVEVLKRYSVENFVFDPIVISSVIASLEDRADRVEFIKVMAGAIKFDSESQRYAEFFERINTSIEKQDFNNVEELISQIFDLFLARITNNFINSMLNKIKSKCFESFDLSVVKSKIASKEKVLLEDVLIISENLKGENSSNLKKTGELLKRYKDVSSYDTEKVAIIINSGKVITLKYPKVFTEMWGHGLEEFLFSEKFADLIVQKVRENGLKYIPYDLAGVFFHLNEWIRDNVRSVIKPEKPKVFDIDTSGEENDCHMEDGTHFSTVVGDSAR